MRRPLAHPCKKPIASRSCVAVVLACAAMPSGAAAQTWTEDAAVRRALEVVPLEGLGAARTRAARGRGQTEAAWSPIELSYTREQTFGPGASGEDYIGATIPIDLGNRRGLRGEAWEHRALAEAGEIDRARRARIAEVRGAFHRVVALRESVAALAGWVERIDTVLESVRQREAAGDAARYDRLRLERERGVAVARHAAEDAARAAAESELASWLGVPGDALVVVDGDMAPSAPPPLTGAVARIDELPDVAAHREEVEAGRLDAESASRAWVPDIGIVLGAKLIDLYGNRTDGFFAGIVLGIPLFDFGGGARMTAEAESEAARIELEVARRDAERAIRAAHVEAERLAAAAAELVTESASRSADLIAIVEASYAGGEAGLLELLDAHRGAAEDRMTLVELGLSAWSARIELDRASGAEIAR
jgi:cobalt-zinc-cadmium efflux system outer membrane protein